MAFGVISALTDIGDVIDNIVSLMVAQLGFSDQGVQDGFRAVSKGGLFYNFKELDNSQRGELTGQAVLTIWPAYSHLTSAHNVVSVTPTPDAARHSVWTSFFDVTGPYPNLYWFADSQSIYFVLEVVNGACVHFGIIRTSEYSVAPVTGGEYVYGYCPRYLTSSSQFVTEPFNQSALPFSDVNSQSDSTSYPSGFPGRLRTGNAGDTSDFAPVAGGSPRVNTTISSVTYYPRRGRGALFGGWYGELGGIGYSRLSNRAPLLPLPIFIEDEVISGLYHDWGEPALMRYVDMTNLSPGEIVDTDWQVFPLGSKVLDLPNFSHYGGIGFAYKRVS